MSGALVYATSAARSRAEKLLPGKCLEVLVEDAIGKGRKRRQPPDGVKLAPLLSDERFVILDSTLGCVLRRVPSRLTGRKAWSVTRLVELKPRNQTALFSTPLKFRGAA
jgi:hypothetical protein